MRAKRLHKIFSYLFVGVFALFNVLGDLFIKLGQVFYFFLDCIYLKESIKF